MGNLITNHIAKYYYNVRMYEIDPEDLDKKARTLTIKKREKIYLEK